MRLVLDTNEYVYGLGPSRLHPCERLIDVLGDSGAHDVRILRVIVQEVCRNLPTPYHRIFFKTLDLLMEADCDIDEEFVVPHHVAQRYQDMGFKEGDAHIGAYAEVVEAEVLVSENRRHFHAKEHHLPFKVMDAAQFLKSHLPGR